MSNKTKAGPIHADRLKSFIERIEKLIEERKAIQGDIKDVYSEAKGVGYDVATMRKVVALRAMDATDRDEMETLIDTYMHALGDAKRMAVEAMQRGAGTREAARAAGIAVGAASQLRTGVHGIANRERVHENQNDERYGGVDISGDDAGHRSEPSSPAEQSVNAGPPRGRLPDQHSSQGEQSGTNSDAAPPSSTPQPAPDGGVGTGTDIFAESANNDAAGRFPGDEGDVHGYRDERDGKGCGSQGLQPERQSGRGGHQGHHGVADLQDGTDTRPERRSGGARSGGGDHQHSDGLDVVRSGGDQGSVALAPEVARAAPPVLLDTRGEASPNPDGLVIPPFLRRTSARAEA